jgi:archaeosortase B (VPXXXP-CTERM-specific)
VSNKKKPVNSQKPRPSGRGFNNSKPPPGQNSFPEGGFHLFWSRYRQVVIPCVVFLAIVGVFIYLYSLLITSDPFHGFMSITARVTAFTLNLFRAGAQVDDTIVSSKQFAFQIVDLCTAVMPMMIFAAGILAFPSRIIAKTYGLVLGLIAIFLINQVRLLSLFFIGIYAPNFFDAAHLLVWQSLMILLALGLWLLWIYKYARTAAV